MKRIVIAVVLNLFLTGFLTENADAEEDVSSWSDKFKSEFGLDATSFAHDGYPDQHNNFSSAFFSTEYKNRWNDDADAFIFKPYFRYDSVDSNRRYADVHDLYWISETESSAFRAGITTATWGVMDFFSLVDVINQRDLLDGNKNAKLGQPMLEWERSGSAGSVQLYTLFGLRERRYAGEAGRLRYPMLVDTDAAEHEYGRLKNVDLAARFKTDWHGLEIALSQFYGMNRDPYFTFNFDFNRPRLVPVYEKINQTGLELRYSIDALILKMEAIYQTGDLYAYESVAPGMEYTWGDLFSKNIDLTFVAEYLYDSRRYDVRAGLNGKAFTALRAAFNDDNQTAAYAGWMVDTKHREGLVLGGVTRNIGEAWKMGLQAAYVYQHEPLIYIDEVNRFIDQTSAEIDANQQSNGSGFSDEYINQVKALASNLKLNARDFNGLVDFVNSLDSATVDTFQPVATAEALVGLAIMTDPTASLRSIERDSYVKLEMTYTF